MADEIKPGYKTTEFWKSAVVVVFGLIMASGVIPSEGPWAQIAGIIAAVLQSVGYANARATTKTGSGESK